MAGRRTGIAPRESTGEPAAQHRLAVKDRVVRACRGWLRRRRSWGGGIPADIGPDSSALVVSVDASADRQGVYYDQSAAVLGLRVVDEYRLVWRAAVDDRDAYQWAVMGDLDDEQAALAAAGMTDRVAGQLIRHRGHVVTWWMGWEQRGDPLAQLA